MSISVFQPKVWEDSLIENFHESSFIGLITTPPTESKGNSGCVFTRIAKGSWKDYPENGKITWDQVAGTKVELTYPNEKYYAFMVEDIDEVQTNKDVLNAVTKEQGAVLAELIDQEVLGDVIKNTKSENILGTKESPISVNPESAYELLVDLNKMANKNKVPSSGRYFLINPDFLAELEKDSRFTKEYEILENGLLKGTNCNINGTQFIVRADNPSDKVVLTHKKGTGYGMQLNGEPEPVRLQDYFADGVRGLTKYGYVALRDDCSYYANVSYAK